MSGDAGSLSLAVPTVPTAVLALQPSLSSKLQLQHPSTAAESHSGAAAPRSAPAPPPSPPLSAELPLDSTQAADLADDTFQSPKLASGDRGRGGAAARAGGWNRHAISRSP